MRGRLWALVVLAWLPLSAPGGEARPLADDPVVEQRMIRLAEELRCLVCQNESLAGSRAELAEDLRREIRAQIRAGKSDAQVLEYLTSRYGDFVLYRPPLKPATWVLWFGPFLLLFGGGWGYYLYYRRRAARLGTDGLSDTERRRVEALLDDGRGDP